MDDATQAAWDAACAAEEEIRRSGAEHGYGSEATLTAFEHWQGKWRVWERAMAGERRGQGPEPENWIVWEEPPMESRAGRRQAGIALSGEWAVRFDTLKERTGAATDSAVIRLALEALERELSRETVS